LKKVRKIESPVCNIARAGLQPVRNSKELKINHVDDKNESVVIKVGLDFCPCGQGTNYKFAPALRKLSENKYTKN
jgi:hypothetical protein